MVVHPEVYGEAVRIMFRYLLHTQHIRLLLLEKRIDAVKVLISLNIELYEPYSHMLIIPILRAFSRFVWRKKAPRAVWFGARPVSCW
jgi:hypothetical protein